MTWLEHGAMNTGYGYSFSSAPPSRRSTGAIAMVLITSALLVLAVVGWAMTYAHSQTTTRHYRAQVVAANDLARATQERAAAAQAATQQLEEQIRQSVGSLDHPTFVLWNVPFTMEAQAWSAETVPDTFDLTAHIHADNRVIVFFVTLDQFACFSTRSCRMDPHQLLVHGQPQYGTDINIVNFSLGEGCGGWVMVIYNNSWRPTTVTGSISATRNPAPNATTGCAPSA